MNMLYSKFIDSRASKFALELILVIVFTFFIADIANDWEEASIAIAQEKAKARGYGYDDIGEAGTYYFAAAFFCFIYYLVWFLRIVYVTKTNSAERLKYEYMDILAFLSSIPIILLTILIIYSIVA